VNGNFGVLTELKPTLLPQFYFFEFAIAIRIFNSCFNFTRLSYLNHAVKQVIKQITGNLASATTALYIKKSVFLHIKLKINSFK